MSQEIERKFLVQGEFKSLSNASYRIAQGYLSSAPERTVRIRIKDDKGFITIKGASSPTGIARYEWEKEITLNDAEELLKLCEPTIIDKTRYIVPHRNLDFEVDVFHGKNEGLIVAEIELEYENQVIELPSWIGREVTGIKKYYNAELSKMPYNLWDSE
jgi:adenylate cyclase